MQQNAINDLLLLISITIDTNMIGCTDTDVRTKYSNKCLFNYSTLRYSGLNIAHTHRKDSATEEMVFQLFSQNCIKFVFV